MHTIECSEGTVFHFRGDRSGRALITRGFIVEDEGRISISCKDLLEFAADYIRSERMNEIEDMSDEELLGVKFR